jgi:small Trp-rich protein
LSYLTETPCHAKWLTAQIDRYNLSQYSEGKGVTVPIIIAIVLLSILRYFEVRPFANLSWWWIIGLLAVAFIWFEFVERLLGLDKRKAHEQLEKARQDRVKKTFK